jgi:hypothetical protein
MLPTGSIAVGLVPFGCIGFITSPLGLLVSLAGTGTSRRLGIHLNLFVLLAMIVILILLIGKYLIGWKLGQ